jgi:hypothetical protein
VVDRSEALRRTATAQYGVINRNQMRAAGLSSRAINYRVNKGEYLRILPGVFMFAGVPDTPKSRLMAAHLWGGEESAISHTSAAWCWGLSGFSPVPIHLSLTRKSRRPVKAIHLHCTKNSFLLDRFRMDALCLTSPSRTLLDIASMGHPLLEKALDQVLREGLDGTDRLWLILDRPELFGHRGTRRLRDLLVERSPLAAPTHSEMEDLFMRVVRWGRFEEPVNQFEVRLSFGPVHVDFAYPERKLAIECDSYVPHGS